MTSSKQTLVAKVRSVANHRNGISGEPFQVVLFLSTEGEDLVAVRFHADGKCPRTAVLGVEKMALDDVAFGSNSYRGDEYDAALTACGVPPVRPGARVEHLRAQAVALIERSRALDAAGDHAGAAKADREASDLSRQVVDLIESFNPFDGPDLPEPIREGEPLPDVFESARGEPAEPPAAQIIDLMDALKKSLKRSAP